MNHLNVISKTMSVGQLEAWLDYLNLLWCQQVKTKHNQITTCTDHLGSPQPFQGGVTSKTFIALQANWDCEVDVFGRDKQRLQDKDEREKITTH